MERRPSRSAIRGVLALLAVASVLTPVLVLRALPPADLASNGLGWVTLVLAAVVAASATIATLASLVHGLRHGSLASLFLAGASAALIGGSLTQVSGTGTIGLSVATAALLVLGASIAERLDGVVGGVRPRILAAGLLLAMAESVLLVGLVPPLGEALRAHGSAILLWGGGLSAIAAIIALTRDLAPAAGALSIAAFALALARGGGAELAFGFAALTGAALLVTRSITDARVEMVAAIHEPLPALATQLSQGVLRFDGHLRLQSWNPAAATLLGLDPASSGERLEDLLGMSLAQLPAGSETVLHRTPVGGLDLSIHRDEGGITIVIHDPGGSADSERLGRELRGTIEELLGARRTIELQRVEIDRAMTTDALTGVASRGAVLERLRIEVAQARRYEHPIAVALIDVDHFGEINLEHGIDGGDTVLREVALRVRLRVRAADALGRSGSDGLLAILPHTDDDQATTFADALRQRVGLRPITIGDAEVLVTLSIGLAIMRPGEDLDLDGLLSRADAALVSARAAGGNRIAVSRSPLDEPAVDRGA
ncbi:MAG: sensor domain-containing diguanylate cyclase [Chloroflexota bacterium]|nr:sensor domain-containing diguanylate cyclase [Chloroflexota bacterium]